MIAVREIKKIIKQVVMWKIIQYPEKVSKPASP